MTTADRAAAVLAELPSGTVALAAGYWRAMRTRLGDRPPSAIVAKRVARRIVTAPTALEPAWPEGTDPLVVGDGAVHADLTDDDRDTFARLREALAPPLHSETLAAEAQRWRLPVTPYRPWPASPPGDDVATTVSALADPDDADAAHAPGSVAGDEPPGRAAARRSAPAGSGARPLDGVRVVDLSALWAGPLATALLADAGARVVKIDPDCRPDGLRHHGRFYRHLNGSKRIVDLDLRIGDDRARFEELVAGADLVVDSFSRRVMPNLSYGPAELRAINSGVATLSIVAFGAGTPEADWVAYGPGVHAASGLADTGGDEAGPASHRFRSAPIAYPDAVAGLAAASVAVELLTNPGSSEHCEVSLLGAIQPLLHHRPRSRVRSGLGEDR